MGRRLILDTDILVEIERGQWDPDLLDDEDVLAIAAISLAEFRVGIELADTRQRADGRERHLAAALQAIEVLDYTENTAVAHGRLIAFVRRAGLTRGAHDLVIAAHAAETGRILMSRDAAARFGDLPGVTAIQPG